MHQPAQSASNSKAGSAPSKQNCLNAYCKPWLAGWPSEVCLLRLLLKRAGKWGGQANLGMGIATFDLMAQLLSHRLVDVAQAWTTRWKTNAPPSPYSTPGNTDALTARAPRCAALLALFWSCGGLSSLCHRQIDAYSALG